MFTATIRPMSARRGGISLVRDAMNGVVQKAPLLANTDNVTFQRFAHD